jgi:hypothetical protein
MEEQKKPGGKPAGSLVQRRQAKPLSGRAAHFFFHLTAALGANDGQRPQQRNRANDHRQPAPIEQMQPADGTTERRLNDVRLSPG